ncbi:hypothetical protein [Deinococcus cellulosilyticus]|uniref:Uncharacterized protein n=1 Tax=Deinococcus cellulosilyticus (strain DSM 18568 / NBRC 106333 / KACC 11606 / 5516J-15) TaxID=1223518 RepID=A0A511N9G8_DEIC1|nr:hypothetical protein [Deinococcus cellulosilyticus]GEM49138.1 hypothetical protein DC3_47730 [Deinococcus cellulosilyticus NBRC 106333 = KACC 11606]
MKIKKIIATFLAVLLCGTLTTSFAMYPKMPPEKDGGCHVSGDGC